MKTKISLVVAQYNRGVHFSDDNYFSFLVDDASNIPGKYLSTKNEKETLKELFEEHLDIYFDWLHPLAIFDDAGGLDNFCFHGAQINGC
jgi:hypothetical protein